jgi:hypothetical protein
LFLVSGFPAKCYFPPVTGEKILCAFNGLFIPEKQIVATHDQKLFFISLRMRKAIYFTLLISLFSCKKSEDTPKSTTGEGAITNLYNFRIIGDMDTAKAFLNGVSIDYPTSGYHITMNSGDSLTFYYIGKETMTQAQVNFAIWKDLNDVPNPRYYYSNTYKRVKKISPTGTIYYYFIPYVKGKFIAP